jgi:hypothetical protein
MMVRPDQMIWATRSFPANGWYDLQARFQEDFDALGSPRNMMLLYVDVSDRETRLFLQVPDREMLARFEDFAPIEANDLPDEAGLLMGHMDDYVTRFRDPRRRS